MPLSDEILKKIRRIEIISKKAAQEVFAGQYHSAFKGRGMEFAEVREYQMGDDVRFIDWNVSSRLGRLFVKQFVEERELTIILAVDLSASLDFFSGTKSKKEVACELAAVIAFTALLNNDKVGLLVFSDRIELFIPPRKGKSHLLLMIRDIIGFSPQGRGTAIGQALAYLNRVIKKKAVVFLISDFLDSDFETQLKTSSRKHDLIAIHLYDRREQIPPAAGWFIFQDTESGNEFLADFSRPQVRQRFQQQGQAREEFLARLFAQYGVDVLRTAADGDYARPLFELFNRRRKKFAR